MKKSLLTWLLVAAASPVLAQTPPSAPPGSAPAADAAQTSYLFGLGFGEQMRNVGVADQVNAEAIARGLKDGLQGKKTTLADRQQVQAFVQTTVQAQSTHNETAAKEFLEHNGHEKNVVTTASGLQYRILSAGDRKAPAVTPTDSVTVQYRGKLLDGSEFDSSYARNLPATFTVNGVIPGWQEALVLMKPGAKWQLFVPPALAYGAQPRPGIPGNSLLIFDVELVSVKAAAAPAGAAPAH